MFLTVCRITCSFLISSLQTPSIPLAKLVRMTCCKPCMRSWVPTQPLLKHLLPIQPIPPALFLQKATCSRHCMHVGMLMHRQHQMVR